MAEKTGFMVKEGGSIKTWKKRYFHLKNSELAYYKDKGAEELGRIALVNTNGIQVSDKRKKA